MHEGLLWVRLRADGSQAPQLRSAAPRCARLRRLRTHDFESLLEPGDRINAEAKFQDDVQKEIAEVIRPGAISATGLPGYVTMTWMVNLEKSSVANAATDREKFLLDAADDFAGSPWSQIVPGGLSRRAVQLEVPARIFVPGCAKGMVAGWLADLKPTLSLASQNLHPMTTKSGLRNPLNLEGARNLQVCPRNGRTSQTPSPRVALYARVSISEQTVKPQLHSLRA